MDPESVPLKQNVSAEPQETPPHNPPMAYPPPYASPSGGQQYYPPPGVVYPGYVPNPDYKGQQPQEQQQQPQAVYLSYQPTGMAPAIVAAAKPVSLVGPTILSCLVTSLCAWICGTVAFILAMVGQCSANDGNNRRALRMKKISYAMSIVGIVVGAIIIGIYIYVMYVYKDVSATLVPDMVTVKPS